MKKLRGEIITVRAGTQLHWAMNAEELEDAKHYAAIMGQDPRDLCQGSLVLDEDITARVLGVRHASSGRWTIVMISHDGRKYFYTKA